MKVSSARPLAIALCMAAGCMLSSCSKTADTAGKDSTMTTTTTTTETTSGGQEQKNIDVTREFVEKVFNNGDMKFAEDHTAANFVEHNAPPGMDPGLEGFKKFVTEWRTAFPDLHVTIDDIIAQGDKVVIRNTFTGTHKGTFMGMAATNKPVKVEGIDIVYIVDGKQTDHWGQADMMGMMTQLGMMPQGAMAPTSEGKMDSKMKSDTAMKMQSDTGMKMK